MPEHSNLITFPSADALAAEVARRWLYEIGVARELSSRHCVALSGGRITTKFFAEVVAQNRARALCLDHIQFFWADERCLPPTDSESNYRMAGELLFMPLKISASQIHRLKGEEDPSAAAREASAELLRSAPANADGQPMLDLVFLGMGEDGHVASLFPNASEDIANCKTQYVVVQNAPKPPPARLSLSYATIAAAKKIWVLVSGAGKAKAFADSLSPGGRTPLGRLLAMRPDAVLFSDL